MEVDAAQPARARAGPASLTDSYAVVREDDTVERAELSHVDAMRLAEALRKVGKVLRVMHVVNGRSHEVDRYPAR